MITSTTPQNNNSNKSSLFCSLLSLLVLGFYSCVWKTHEKQESYGQIQKLSSFVCLSENKTKNKWLQVIWGEKSPIFIFTTFNLLSDLLKLSCIFLLNVLLQIIIINTILKWYQFTKLKLDFYRFKKEIFVITCTVIHIHRELLEFQFPRISFGNADDLIPVYGISIIFRGKPVGFRENILWQFFLCTKRRKNQDFV